MSAKGSIKGVSYFLGKKKSIYQLQCFENREDSIVSLKNKGLCYYAKSDLTPAEMALETCKNSLVASAIAPKDIDAIVYASASFWQKSFYTEGDISWLMHQLGLTKAFPIGVSMPGCANMFSALQVALNMVKADGYKNVLLVTTDKVSPENDYNRVMWPDISVLSDGATSCIISQEGCGDYDVLKLCRFSDPSMWNLNYETNLPGFLLKTIKGSIQVVNEIFDGESGRCREIRKIITNNYNISVMETTAKKLGFENFQMFLGNVSEFGHCYAADTLINLKSFSEQEVINPNDLFVLLGTGHKHWGCALLRAT